MYNVTLITTWEVINNFPNVTKIILDSEYIRISYNNDFVKLDLNKIKDIKIRRTQP